MTYMEDGHFKRVAYPQYYTFNEYDQKLVGELG